MQPVLAFIDESGDALLNVESGASPYFVVVAVMVEPGEGSDASDRAESLRARHFQTGEMKSSKIGSNKARRTRILSDISDLPFTAHVLLVDKSQIHRDGGLRWKPSFLKYIHNQLYQRLFRAIPDLAVVADRHGYPEFMEGFERYVREVSMPSLFSPDADFRFEDSAAQPLIQVADVLAGSIYNAAINGGREMSELLDLLAGKILTFLEWPPVVRPVPAETGSKTTDGDALIRRHSMNLAARYIEEMGSLDDEVARARVAVLRRLYFAAYWESDDRYVGTAELLQHLEASFGITMSPHLFRSTVIAPMRDEGVLLASGNRGYKLPTCADDIESFVAMAEAIIGPLLERINIAREEILTLTNGRIDLLEGREFLRRRDEV